MSPPDFYTTFGISPSASQEEIRAAHRELVKRYHPDIYSTSEDKARATEKLQAINEAYAVLGNTELRRQYDAKRVEQLRREQSVAQHRPAHARRERSTPRFKTPTRLARSRRKPHWKKKKYLTWPRLAGAVAAATLFAVTTYLVTGEPEVLAAWVLLQRTEVEPAASAPPAGARGWEQLGRFGVRAECARVLKTHVRADQEQGSQAVFDENIGTLAITVLLSEIDSPPGGNELLAGEKRITKRVRHYECRTVQVRQPDFWLRRILRQSGFVD